MRVDMEGCTAGSIEPCTGLAGNMAAAFDNTVHVTLVLSTDSKIIDTLSIDSIEPCFDSFKIHSVFHHRVKDLHTCKRVVDQ